MIVVITVRNGKISPYFNFIAFLNNCAVHLSLILTSWCFLTHSDMIVFHDNQMCVIP